MRPRFLAALTICLCLAATACTRSVHIATSSPIGSLASRTPSSSPSIFSPIPHSPKPEPPSASGIGISDGGETDAPTGPSGDIADNGPARCTGSTQGVTEREVEVQTRFTCYEIHGRTAEQLNDEMARLGPSVEGTIDAVASTKWKPSWSNATIATTEECKVTTLSVGLRIVFTFPHWNQPAGVPHSLVQSFDAFLNDVRKHEYKHRKIAIEGANELQELLSKLGPQPTCEDLTATTSATAKRVIHAFEKKQKEFDASEAAKAGGV